MPYLGVKPADEFSSKDLNGEQLILDADADTTITADTDDQIDIRISGADDFKFTANTLTALSGSTIATNTIAETTGASGVTIDGLLIKDSTAAFADGAVATPSITNTGDLNSGVYFPAADTVGITAGGTEQFRFGSNPIPGGNKNLLINGAMSVSQRGTSFTSFGASDSEYGVDRWKIRSISSASARWTASQESSGGDSGKDKWLKILCTTADGSPGTNETQWITQTIEGFNSTAVVADDASTKSMSVSLDIIAHADGAGSISFPAKVAVFLDMSAGASREYVHDVTIAAADTWERVTFSAPADSFNTWTTDNAANLGIGISLYGGSGRVGAEDTYRASGRDNITSNTDNWADATNNYIGFTNVQLEVGGVATDFAYEDIGTTLSKCQRYFNRAASGNTNALPPCMQESTTNGYPTFQFPVQMRVKPSLDYSDLTHFGVDPGASQQNPSVMAISYGSGSMAWLQVTWGSATGATNNSTRFYTLSASATLDFSAEL